MLTKGEKKLTNEKCNAKTKRCKMLSAKDVAKFFIKKGSDEDDDVTNLKLQKLLYYAQGFHLAFFGRPLFEEDIEAWTHGPVVPEIYHQYKAYGKEAIGDIDEDIMEKLTDEQIDFLYEIWSVFGQYSAWKLRNMTHDEKPWKDHEKDASVISKKELKDYFSTRVEED